MRLALIAASLCIGLSLSACTILSTRPDRQIAYAEAAFQAATNAGAETLAPQVFSVAAIVSGELDLNIVEKISKRLESLRTAHEDCRKRPKCAHLPWKDWVIFLRQRQKLVIRPVEANNANSIF